MNNVVIKGRLASDPEMEITNSGKKVCRIQVAVHRRFQSSHYEQAGIRRVQGKLVAEDIEFCGSRIETKPSEVSPPQAEEKPDNHITQEEIVKYNLNSLYEPMESDDFPF